ncbi:MAG: sigma-54-dependent Fis family transcriptional regulator [Gemmatimonadota bacterium]|nr:MAG: sigma-54-dependent Fis family transcriptional regulator [Gemmatimonadota bacterium]
MGEWRVSADIRILLAEDERNLSRILETQLRKKGFEVEVAYDGRAAVELLKGAEFDVALVDLVMPELDGIGVLREAAGLDAPPEVVIVTGNGTVETAIAAMKLGAYDYVTKPCRVAELEMLVRRAYEKRRLAQENVRLQTRLSRREEFPEIVTASPAMESVLELVRKVASSNSAVLITGESGTGKELVARAIHRLSPRGEGPLTDINCAAIQENLLESELFGHERGAFTGAMTRKLGLFELADGGTLFMDEIAELAPRLQSKLLRALEMGEFFRVGGTQKVSTDIRLLAATNRDLEHEVAEGNFREDLFYRVNTLTIHIPPLRERHEDIPVLARHFLERQASATAPELTDTALDALVQYSWPGNVRELRNVMERLAILRAGERIQLEDLPRDLARDQRTDGGNSSLIGESVSLEHLERAHIEAVLSKENWHQGRAADTLGISAKTLYRKIRLYGLERTR